MERKVLSYLPQKEQSTVRVGMGWGGMCCRFCSRNKESLYAGPQRCWTCRDREWGQQILLQVLRVVEMEEEVTRVITNHPGLLLSAEDELGLWPHVQEGSLEHRALPMGMAILTWKARQWFSKHSMGASFLTSSRCRSSLRSEMDSVGGMWVSGPWAHFAILLSLCCATAPLL